MANRTMNIMKRRITMEPMLELAKSLVWWAGSTVAGLLVLDLGWRRERVELVIMQPSNYISECSVSHINVYGLVT